MDAVAVATRCDDQESKMDEMDFNSWMKELVGLGPMPPLAAAAADWLTVGNWPAQGWESLPISSRSRCSRQHFVLQRCDALELETGKREAMIFVELPRTCIFPAEFL